MEGGCECNRLDERLESNVASVFILPFLAIDSRVVGKVKERRWHLVTMVAFAAQPAPMTRAGFAL